MPTTSRRQPNTRINKNPSLRKPRRNDSHYCKICNVQLENEAGFKRHLESEQHLIHYCLQKFQKHRKRSVKDRHGILVKASYDSHVVIPDGYGSMKLTIPPETKDVTYKFILENVGSKPLVYCGAHLLHPYPAFALVDEDGKKVTKDKKVLRRIHPDCGWCEYVKFTNPGRGTYEVPVSFHLVYTKDNEEKEFQVIRFVIVKVRGTDYLAPEQVDTGPSPFQGDIWSAKYLVEGATREGRELTKPTAFPIPRDLFALLHHWLEPWDDISVQLLEKLTSLIDIILKGYEYLESNYEFYFHNLLYLDEYDGMVHLQRYNMRGVLLKLLHDGDTLELMVPGLAEKRPSLLKGDLIHCRFRYESGQTDEVEYQGQIIEVRDTSVILSNFSPEFLQRHCNDPTQQVDVRFFFSRYPISVAHTAVNRIVQKNLLKIIFPQKSKPLPPLLAAGVGLKFFNDKVESNPLQKNAVLNIVKASCRPAPYIIFGPPGTGKTVTVVEAILQVKKMCKGSRVLVCAPSNAACDLVASRIVPFVKQTEMIRIHSNTRDWTSVPECLHAYSNRSEELYFFPDEEALKQFRIVVCTLVTSHKLMGKNTEKDLYYEKSSLFSHVFIDECGQAMEPESLIPLGAGLGSSSVARGSGVVVLAGDPCQLGPCCNSRRAENVAQPLYDERDVGNDELSRLNRRMGLGISLLERLMITSPLYQKDSEGNYDSMYITKLLLNYRSHPDILELPNELFYSGELIANCPDTILHDRVCQKILTSNGKKPCSIVFHGVLGKEKREGRSPSYFNRYEADQVLAYVRKLLNPSGAITVKQSDIGIIAPYIRQVYRIKNALKNKNWGEVEVGTTETFQGREKRVMIISTVRANPNLLDYDFKFRLGFVADPKRFNVAVTRAQSLLIIVGNPYQLVYDSRWKALMDFCIMRGSYIGSTYCARDERWWNHVVDKLAKLSEND